MKRNRLKITMESRIHGDVYVRFGGERLETYRPKGRQGALRLACGTGKTLIMCIAAHEMKRLNLAQGRPLSDLEQSGGTGGASLYHQTEELPALRK